MPDLDPFAPKDLADTGAEAGVEDDDLALDLDPDKGDDDLGNLDSLETNDPHLDDLLNSDEFDLLAYTDPELDQGDPKDVFSDQLRLVEAEGEGSGLAASVDVKVERRAPAGGTEDAKVTAQPLVKTESATPSISSPPKAELSETAQLSAVKLEEMGPQAAPVVKTERESSVSMILTRTPSKISTQPENSASLSTVHLAAVSFPPPAQAEPLPFSPAAPHPDLPEDSLGLPDGGGQHSPAVDLDKVESTLESSELPLLIQDLLEHENKELQKQQQQQQQQQQLNVLQSGMSGHLQNLQTQQQAPPTGPGQILLPHHRPPQVLVAQPGMVRPPHMMAPQQQQRMMGVAQQQNMVRPGQPGGVHAVLDPQQQVVPTQHLAKQQTIPGNFFPDKGRSGVLSVCGLACSMLNKTVCFSVLCTFAHTFASLSDLDKFMTDDIMDPIAKAKMVALKGIKRVLTQDPNGVSPGINRYFARFITETHFHIFPPFIYFCYLIVSGNRYHSWLRGLLQLRGTPTRSLFMDRNH